MPGLKALLWLSNLPPFTYSAAHGNSNSVGIFIFVFVAPHFVSVFHFAFLFSSEQAAILHP